MRHTLLIHGDAHAVSGTERDQCDWESVQLAHEIDAAGQYRAAAPLCPTSTATSVRVCKGKRLVTDGPFAEKREQLGGYFMVDARDLDEAIPIAEQIPMAWRGTVEVRLVVGIPSLPMPTERASGKCATPTRAGVA